MRRYNLAVYQYGDSRASLLGRTPRGDRLVGGEVAAARLVTFTLKHIYFMHHEIHGYIPTKIIAM